MALAIFDLGLFRPRAPIFDPYPCSRLLHLASLSILRHTSTLAVPALDTQITSTSTQYSLHGNLSSAAARDDDAYDEEMAQPRLNKLCSRTLGIRSSMISKPTRKVLNDLKRKGYEVYLVGGCVRDMILRRTPKDFDIITSAELKEVVRAFSWCEIVGRRFPICHVHMDNSIVEVSSFTSCGKKISRALRDDIRKPPDFDEKDYLRWRDSLQRDFTINGLFFDPYANIIYDYVRGMEDIRKAKVQTVIPAGESFGEDSARILRAIRIAGRLGFRLSRETAYSIRTFSSSVLRLDKGRILMELNYMLAYGSAEATLRLLWRYGVLDILLPVQAAYFVQSGFKRRDRGSNMLLSLFSNLDKLLAPNRPCHSILWVGMLAFHKALYGHPRHPSVVAAYSLAINNGGNMVEALKIARTISRPHDPRFVELLQEQWGGDPEVLRDDVMNLAKSIKEALSSMTDENFVSQAMAAYPEAPYSDLVFIPLGLYIRVCRMFQCVTRGSEDGFRARQGGGINYDLLAQGNMQEVRHTFARVVFDTVYPTIVEK
ncbi:hypothetical protein SAY86_016359 [Trapa natans]|uniref:Poly(A) polymerase n=1 Tax=Trapa natans TaxID=22666 RepID=A0AAN7LLA0_TRANT|nr:hypothetical protein SAY86_016359 [Trapa natans]